MFIWRGRGFLRGFKHRISPVEFLILLSLLEKPRHGYEIIKELEERFEDTWTPKSGTFYPSLSRLENKGYIKSVVRGNRKLYTLTRKGIEIVKEIAENFDKEVEFLDRFIQIANFKFLEEFTQKYGKKIIEKMLDKAFKTLDIAIRKTELLDLNERLKKLQHTREMLEKRLNQLTDSISRAKRSVEDRRKKMVKIKVE
ncbi:MAG: helix-turn-helix transcriptional regulator [Candidatus Baldrarchaeia archaeon]